MVVSEELNRLGLRFATIELGEVELLDTISKIQKEQLSSALLKSGLELLDDKKSVLIQKIKNAIIDLVHSSEEPLAINLSIYLTQKLSHNYTYLANVFSEAQDISIEKFYITHKIERVKELLIYDELTLTEISFKMDYSSVSHLSNQFKKVTGLTPSQFKQRKDKNRLFLDDV